MQFFKLSSPFLICLIGLLFFSCKKNDNTPSKPSLTDTAALWKQHPGITLDEKIVQYLYPTDSFLYAATTNYILKIDKNNNVVSSYKVFDVGNALYSQPFLNSKFYGYVLPDRKGVTIGLIDKPWIKKQIILPLLDSTAFGIDERLYEVMAINNMDQLVLPVTGIFNKSTVGFTYLFMFNLQISGDSISVKLNQKVKLKVNNYYDTYNNIFAVDSNFYFSSEKDTVNKLTPSGIYAPILPFRFCFHVKSSDTSIFIGFNDNYNMGIYASTSTWSSKLTFNQPLNYGFIFTGFANRIIAIFQSQIWLTTVNYSKSTLQFNELNTDGMPPSEIRSAVFFNGKVYLATFQGLYYKSLNHFLIFK